MMQAFPYLEFCFWCWLVAIGTAAGVLLDKDESYPTYGNMCKFIMRRLDIANECEDFYERFYCVSQNIHNGSNAIPLWHAMLIIQKGTLFFIDQWLNCF